MNYLLDTNIVLLSIRSEHFRHFLLEKYFSTTQIPIISVVSIGELRSLAIRNDWGENKWLKMSKILDSFLVSDIHSEDIIQRYAEIDAFSQGKTKLNVSFSAKNMEKNDLWIAATTSILSATLLTTDKDFDHLNDIFLKVERIDYKNILL